jgi:hypothetical protein
MTYRDAIELYKVDRILALFLAAIGIMTGGNADYQDTFNLILTGASDYLRVTTYTLIIGMAGMLMAYRDNVSRQFAECIPQIR